MTLNQISSAILNDLHSGLKGATINVNISVEQIEDEVITTRNMLLKQQSLNGIANLRNHYVNINCIPLECEDVSDCCEGFSFHTAKTFTIPRPIDILNSVAYIGTIDKKKSFKVYFDESYAYHQHNRLIKDRPYVWLNLASLKDGVIKGYLFNSSVKKISISLIPEDFRTINNCNVECEERDVVIASSMIEEIKQVLLNKYVKLYRTNQPIINIPNTQTSIV